MKWRIPFLVLSLVLLGLIIIWVIKEIRPEWKRYQEAEYAEQRQLLEQELERWLDPKWGDPKVAKKVQERINALEKPRLEVKQVLLKGTGLWKEGESGEKADRCITCHVNEDKLSKLHPSINEYFPLDIYGCTVCHGGQGESLKLKKAHKDMHPSRKEMLERIVTADAVMDLWKRLAKLTPEEGKEASDFKYYGITGEKAVYVGSTVCMRCHKGLTTWHINRWKDNKFVTFEKVKNAPDYIEGDENYKKGCYTCHTTGYDEKTGKYSEEGVTCEACHGPGQLYVYFMSMGKVAEAQRLSKLGFTYEICGNCHMARNHEARAQFMAQHNLEEKPEPAPGEAPLLSMAEVEKSATPTKGSINSSGQEENTHISPIAVQGGPSSEEAEVLYYTSCQVESLLGQRGPSPEETAGTEIKSSRPLNPKIKPYKGTLNLQAQVSTSKGG
jgi:hypothetical protein